MPTIPTQRPDVVGRLRAAGCVFARMRLPCWSPPRPPRRSWNRWFGGGSRGCRWNTCWAGRSFVASASRLTPRCLSHAVAPSTLSGWQPGSCRRAGRPGRPLWWTCVAVRGPWAPRWPQRRAAGVARRDVDPAAAACARRNLQPLGAEVHEGDLYGPLPERLRGRVDILAVNAPYVPSGMIGTMPQRHGCTNPVLPWTRPGRAGAATASGRRGAGMAGAGRPSADRDEPAASAADHRDPCRERALQPRLQLTETGRHRGAWQRPGWSRGQNSALRVSDAWIRQCFSGSTLVAGPAGVAPPSSDQS